jgi:predicted permease
VNTISTIIVPFFALILFGYVAARMNWVPPAAVPAFNGFLLYFAVPALLFRFASTAAFGDIMNGRFFAAYTMAGLLTLAVVVIVAWRLLANAAGPCALFAIGVSAFRPDTPLRSSIVALPISGKLLLHPLAVWATTLLFDVDPFTATVGVLTAALPTAGWAFIFAQRYEADAGRVSAAVLFSTALSFITFSALVWFLGMDVPAK